MLESWLIDESQIVDLKARTRGGLIVWTDKESLMHDLGLVRALAFSSIALGFGFLKVGL